MDQKQKQKGRLDGVLSLYLMVAAPRLLKYTIPKLLYLGFSCLRQMNSCFFSWSCFGFFLVVFDFFLCLMRLKLFSCLCGKYNHYINVKKKNFSLPVHKEHFYLILKA